MRSSLDDFQRFIAKQEQGREETAPAAVAIEEASSGIATEVQYILRGGITVAVPGKTRDVPTNEVVVEESALPTVSESAGADDPSMLAQAALWQRLPRHIQLLARIADNQEEEAAQKYYTRGFKESRQQLIERLLDPTLTLEDTARVLGVVPATVRRYTNRGALPHYRTVGQQRRFRLSDVLAFLEAQQGGAARGGSED